MDIQRGPPECHSLVESSRAIEITLTLLSLTKPGWKDESTERKPTQHLKRQDNGGTESKKERQKTRAKKTQRVILGCSYNI